LDITSKHEISWIQRVIKAQWDRFLKLPENVLAAWFEKPVKPFEVTTGRMRPEGVNKLPSSLPAV
jgi:hypothetical protein